MKMKLRPNVARIRSTSSAALALGAPHQRQDQDPVDRPVHREGHRHDMIDRNGLACAAAKNQNVAKAPATITSP